jgi:hypothetical protein
VAATYTIELKAESSAIDAAVEELLALGADAPEIFLHLPENRIELISFRTDDGCPACAGELLVHLEPSQRFLDLLAALRAGNI